MAVRVHAVGAGARSWVAIAAGCAVSAGAAGYAVGLLRVDAPPPEGAARGSRPAAGAREARETSRWLREFDRTLALRLRRAHLDLIDERLAAIPLPAAGGDDPELAAALDEWAMIRRARRDEEGSRLLDALVRRLDPDPDRARVRDLAASGDAPALRALARIAPESWPPQSLALLGRALAAAGAPDTARRLLERSIERAPGEFGLHLALADLLFLEGPAGVEGARRHFGAAQALRPDSVRAAVRHAWLLADQGGEPSAAIALLDAAARRAPDEPVVAYALGVALFRARHVEEARGALRRALDLDSRFALALAALGEISLDQREFERAERAFRRSLEFADTADARDGLAGALFPQGRLDEALVLLEESVRRHPDDALLRDHLAGSLSQAGRFAEALAHLREAIHLDPWIAEVQNDYAWELVNSGDPALRRPGKALEHTQRACELEPDNAWYRNTLGVTHYRLGDFEQCVAELEAACEMPRGGGPYDLFFLAMAKQQLGLHAEALELFARATAAVQENNDELVRLRAEAEALLEARGGGGGS